MISSVRSGSGGFDFSQGSYPQVTLSISCVKDIHGYYACLHRGEQVIWATTEAFSGYGRELFTLDWDLSLMQPGDSYAVIGFVTNLNDEAIRVCSCEGLAQSLYQQKNLLLS